MRFHSICDTVDDDTKFYVRFALPTTQWLFYCKIVTVVSGRSLYLLLFCFTVFVYVYACMSVLLCAHTPAFVQLDEINHPIRGVCSAACFFFSFALTRKAKYVKRIFFSLFVLVSHTHAFIEHGVRKERTIYTMYSENNRDGHCICMCAYLLKRGNSIVRSFVCFLYYVHMYCFNDLRETCMSSYLSLCVCLYWCTCECVQ